VKVIPGKPEDGAKVGDVLQPTTTAVVTPTFEYRAKWRWRNGRGDLEETVTVSSRFTTLSGVKRKVAQIGDRGAEFVIERREVGRWEAVSG
jgi:hypothetical protein